MGNEQIEMKALVTGGGGFLGKKIVSALIDKGIQVRSFARGDYPELTQMGVDHVRGDLVDAESITAACRDMDIVYHVASLVSPFGRPQDFDRINIDGTRNVITACRENNVKYLVFTSTPSVIHDGNDAEGIDESKPYPDSFLCDYFRSKAVAEKSILEANDSVLANGQDVLRTCSLRPHAIFGPGDLSLFPILLQKAKAGRLRILGSGNTKIDWTYVDNAVQAHLNAGDALQDMSSNAAGKAYFIANDEPVNPWEFFNQVLSELDLPRIEKRVPLQVALKMGGVMEFIWRTLRLDGEPPATRAMASVMGTSHYFDLSAAKKDLGYEPHVPLQEGIARTVPWLREELKAGRI
jgi:2-alkyl-3-oxoalkanoate reductase